MNTTSNPAIPIPSRLRRRPLWSGYPIPFVNLIDKHGVPDFRAIDEDKRLKVIMDNRCQLCGLRLGSICYFAAGLPSYQALSFFEPALHLECLIYAMQVCPFIIGKKAVKSELSSVQTRHAGEIRIMESGSPDRTRDPVWYIVGARSYTLRENGEGGEIHLVPDQLVNSVGPLLPESMDQKAWEQVRLALQK